MKIISTLFICIYLSSWSFAQPGDVPPNAEPGKCYAKSKIIKAPEEVTETYPVYLGSNANAPGLKTITIIHKEAHTEWVDRTMPNGQTKHCLVEVPEATEEISILKDTVGRTDYILETFTFYRNYPRNNYTDWREVICNDKVHEGFVSDLQRALIKKGFYQGEVNGRVDRTTKAALVKYQRYAYLPIGNLDVETLGSLEIYP